jgi:hypothetical protein
MILCFPCTAETKDGLDRLLATGSYRDYGEAISAAVRNQVLMEQEVANRGALFIGEVTSPKSKAPTDGHQQEKDGIASKGRTNGKSDKNALAKPAAVRLEVPPAPILVPPLFRRDHLPEFPPKGLAAMPADMWTHGQTIPLDRWVLGQFNRLLPAKANARALVLLFLDSPKGLEITAAASTIAAQAAVLGDYLRQIETKHGVSRDDALSTAFPTADEGAEKGRTRYANQFVVYQNSRGELSGLMVALKLINVVTQKKKRLIVPTRVAWEFARLPNPVLDASADEATEKFSPEERALLLGHIVSSVPVESFAYQAILEAIQAGNNTPDKIDAALKAYVAEDRAERLSQSFLASQRSGAVSRMSDLWLVERQRDGVRVSYIATEQGRDFLAQCVATAK